MDSEPENIEKELDQLTIRILTLMNQYIRCKKNIENHIRSGCLDLAKARYIMGNRNISSLQLPADNADGVTANFRVGRSQTVETEFESIRNEPVENIASSLENISLNGEDKKKPTLGFSKNPLKWFGFLIPQNLRQSKTTFERCLEIVVECANIQLELQRNLEEFRNLKKSLVKES